MSRPGLRRRPAGRTRPRRRARRCRPSGRSRRGRARWRARCPSPRPAASMPRPGRAPSRTRRSRPCGPRCAEWRAGPWIRARRSRAVPRAGCTRPAWPPRSARPVFSSVPTEMVMSIPSSLSSTLHLVHPGVVADPRSLEHPENGADRVGVQHHGAGQAAALGEHLDVVRRRPVGRHDELHHALPLPVARGSAPRAPGRTSERAKALTARSANPEPMSRASV